MIPIYRAKKIDSDEWVKGSLLANAFYKRETKIPCCYIFNTDGKEEYDCMDDLGYVFEENEVDPNTLAIHFPNMIDKNGKKIFASLSKDGVGGDIVNYNRLHGNYIVDKKQNVIVKLDTLSCDSTIDDIEVIGIHKGE